MKFDFSFDKRVAQQYDAQRLHPPEVAQQIGAAIVSQAGAGGRVLEIGVGTGRIAWPIVAAGGKVVGFDLSPEMMGEVFREERPFTQKASLQLLQADMHHIPFVRDSFKAVVAVHVLHLAKDWQQVLQDAARVLRPDGVFIQGDDWIDPNSVTGQLRDELRRQAMALSPMTRPPAAGVSKQDFLYALGGTELEEFIAAEWTTWLSPNERLKIIEQRLDAESWMFPEDIFNILFQKLQLFAANTWDDLDEQQAVTRRFLLKVLRGNWV